MSSILVLHVPFSQCLVLYPRPACSIVSVSCPLSSSCMFHCLSVVSHFLVLQFPTSQSCPLSSSCSFSCLSLVPCPCRAAFIVANLLAVLVLPFPSLSCIVSFLSYSFHTLNSYLLKTLLLSMCNLIYCYTFGSCLVFTVPGFSNLFTGSTLNALDLYMKYTAEVFPLCTYIEWFTFV